ncbi:MAG: TonB-dependent receptor, partial [Verrucomicrobiota bacterium]
LDGLSIQRIEIDMIEFSGTAFEKVDNRLMSLRLVQKGLSNATMFGPDGTVLQPSNVLRKRPLLIERGSFIPFCKSHQAVLNAADEQFCDESSVDEDRVFRMAEITMKKLATDDDGEVDYQDFLARADMLCACGLNVMISNYFEYYRLAQYLRIHTQEKIGMTMGLRGLEAIFDESYYEHLDGGILESFGRLFKQDVTLYVYPSYKREEKKVVTLDDWKPKSELKHLFKHLKKRDNIEELEDYDEDLLKIFSNDVLELIKNGDDEWEEKVPEPVAEVIKENGYFGYKG